MPFIANDYSCHFPLHYVIDTGNVCNLECPFCYTGAKTPGITKGLMSLEHFKIIFEKIKPHAKQIDLYNWGEPFLNKDLLKMISLCSEAGIHTHIDSTLSTIDMSDYDAQSLVKSGISSLFVSIDGITQEVYEKYRVGGKVDRVINNIRKINVAKTNLGSQTPKLAMAYYIHKFNEHQINDATKLAEELKIKIWYKPLACPPNWQSSYHLDFHAFFPQPEWVTQYYPLPHHSQFDKIIFHKNIKTVISACRQPFNSMVINWNGDVTPCTTVTGTEYVIGNLLLDDLDNVWNNLEHKKCREFLLNYGNQQTTKSVCETRPCPLVMKFI